MSHLLHKAEEALLTSSVPADLIEHNRKQYEGEQQYLVQKDGTLAQKGLSADMAYSKMESLGRSFRTWLNKRWKGWSRRNSFLKIWEICHAKGYPMLFMMFWG